MKRAALLCILALAAPALAVGTSNWSHTTEADFKNGTFENVVATNLGDLKLSRAVKTLLEQDPHISSVSCLAEGPDGVIYAGTGPRGLLLAIKGDAVSTIATIDGATELPCLTVDKDGRLLIGTAGEQGRVLRLDKPGEKDAKPVEVFKADGVQYVWQVRQTPDGNLYVATGPAGQLFEVKPDGSSRVLLDTDENNITALISDGKDTLYAGTDPHGLVYRVNRKTGQSFVLYDAAESEVSALVLDAKGNLYASTAEAKDGAGTGAARAVDAGGRPEGGATGVPITSEPPKEPKPPALPDPNPGKPNPIPKSPGNNPADLGATGADALSPLPVLRERDRVRVLPEIASDLRFATEPSPLPSPGVPGEGERGRAPRFAHAHPGESLLALALFAAPAPPPPPGAPKPPPIPGPPGAGPTTAPAQPPAPGRQPVVQPGAAEPRAEGNAVYKIDPDGFVTEIFRQNVLVLSMVESDGSLMLATGSEGQIYQVNPAAEETIVLAKVEPKQVMCLLPAKDGRIYMGLANVGGVAAMSSGFATKGTYTSPVLDAAQISRFGKMRLNGTLAGGTTITVSTRSGNVKDAAETGWSEWTAEAPALEYLPVASPSARFLQYRLTFTSKDGKNTPVVEDVDVAYQTPNLAPRVASVKLATAADPAAAANIAAGGEAPRIPSARRQTITWEASDPNNDALQYAVYFRRGQNADAPWILLKEKLTETTLEWDTRAVADGRYAVKVVASDAAANVAGKGKTASRVSDPITVDNTPPAVGDLKWTEKGNEVKVEFRVVDRSGVVAAADFSVDSSRDWQAVLPSDTIWDSPEETAAFSVQGLAPGVHQVTVRATDARGNVAFENVSVTVQGPAAAKP